MITCKEFCGRLYSDFDYTKKSVQRKSVKKKFFGNFYIVGLCKKLFLWQVEGITFLRSSVADLSKILTLAHVAYAVCCLLFWGRPNFDSQ